MYTHADPVSSGATAKIARAKPLSGTGATLIAHSAIASSSDNSLKADWTSSSADSENTCAMSRTCSRVESAAPSKLTSSSSSSSSSARVCEDSHTSLAFASNEPATSSIPTVPGAEHPANTKSAITTPAHASGREAICFFTCDCFSLRADPPPKMEQPSRYHRRKLNRCLRETPAFVQVFLRSIQYFPSPHRRRTLRSIVTGDWRSHGWNTREHRHR